MGAFTKVISIAWIVNFAVYVVIAAWLGGNAFNGHSEAGHYYLAYHGRATEVSQTAFEYSRWHTYVLFAHFAIAFPLGMLVRRGSNSAKPVI
ncbi:MAG TPA: hypothetical protein VE907_20300 [Gammaproteobacteria bacterium]|nr:hypothetical protein [Gammaproteobacteria bacterium]